MLKSEKFWDFRVLTSKVVRFLMPIGNSKSISLQILYPYSISWDKTPLYFLAQKYIYFAQKEPIKVETFETFECSSQNWSISLCQFWSDKSIPLQILYPYPILWKITPLYFFSSKNIYLVQKEHIKMKILRLSSARVKILQIPHINVEMTSQFLFKFCHTSSSWRITPLWILSSYFFNFALKDPIKNLNFETFKCSGENWPYPSCHFPNHKSV